MRRLQILLVGGNQNLARKIIGLSIEMDAQLTIVNNSYGGIECLDHHQYDLIILSQDDQENTNFVSLIQSNHIALNSEIVFLSNKKRENDDLQKALNRNPVPNLPEPFVSKKSIDGVRNTLNHLYTDQHNYLMGYHL